MDEFSYEDFSEEAVLFRGGNGMLSRIRPKRMLSPELVPHKSYLLKTSIKKTEQFALQSSHEQLDQISKALRNDNGYLNSRLALPIGHVVIGIGGKVGYLMREFHEGCYINRHFSDGTTKQVLNQVKNHLNSAPEKERLGTPTLTLQESLEILEDYFTTLSLIHERNIVVGDVSGNNILLQNKPHRRGTTRAIVLDVDSFRFEAGNDPAEGTLHWFAPEHLDNPELPPTRQSDVYKSALLAIRLIRQASQPEFATFDSYDPEGLERSLHHFSSGVELSRELVLGLSSVPAERPKSQKISHLLSRLNDEARKHAH